jgi:hypothetical protein
MYSEHPVCEVPSASTYQRYTARILNLQITPEFSASRQVRRQVGLRFTITKKNIKPDQKKSNGYVPDSRSSRPQHNTQHKADTSPTYASLRMQPFKLGMSSFLLLATVPSARVPLLLRQSR